MITVLTDTNACAEKFRKRLAVSLRHFKACRVLSVEKDYVGKFPSLGTMTRILSTKHRRAIIVVFSTAPNPDTIRRVVRAAADKTPHYVAQIEQVIENGEELSAIMQFIDDNNISVPYPAEEWV